MIVIRPYQSSDTKDLLEIYKPYIEKSAITFEILVPKLEDWKQRIEKINKEFPWLVAIHDNQIIGFAYATRFRERKAYDWCCECSIYLTEKYQGKGIATELYNQLFAILKNQNYVNVYAIMTSPNPKSEKFHRSFGFYDVGIFTKSGYKLGNWWDTHWMQFHLGAHENPPMKIIHYSEIKIN